MSKRIHSPYEDLSHGADPVSIETLSETGAPGSHDRLLLAGQILWTERRFIAKLALWVAVLTCVYALFLPNTYRSTTLLMPPDDQSGTKASLAMMAGMASKVGGGDLGMLASDLLGNHSTGDLLIGIIHSRTAQETMVDRFDLTKVYGIPWLRLRAKKEDARKQLEFNTETAQDRKSGIITITLTDRDPNRAAALANGYVDQLNSMVAGLSTSAAARERQFLEQRLKEVKKDLDDAGTQLSQFSSKNTTFDPAIQGKATVEAAAALEGELIAAQAQLRGLEAIYTGDNVRVRSIRARVNELNKQLHALTGSTLSGESSTAEQAADSGMPFPSLRQLPILGATYVDLYRRAKIEETVYQILTQQYELAKVQEAKDIPTIRVLDRGAVPPRKSGPHRAILSLLGGILGMLLGCIWILGADRWRQWEPSDPRKAFVQSVCRDIADQRVSRRILAMAGKLRGRTRSGRRPWLSKTD